MSDGITIGKVGAKYIRLVSVVERAIAVAAALSKDESILIAMDRVTGRLSLHDRDAVLSEAQFALGINRVSNADEVAEDIRTEAIDCLLTEPPKRPRSKRLQ